MRRSYQWICVMLLFTMCSFCAVADRPVIHLETNLGTMAIELYPDKAPLTVDNFLRYANSGYYDNLVFHRVISGFMIQAGAYYLEGNYIYPASADPSKVLGNPIINESYNGLSNLRGTIAMARTTAPNSATAQFYINHTDNLFLDKANAADGFGYCVFGKVISGLDAVDRIAGVPTAYIDASLSDFPVDPPVVISRVFVGPCDSSYCSNLSVDTQVNIQDFAKIASHWLDDACGSANSFCGGSDLDYSGTIDIVDLSLLLDHWTGAIGYEPQFSNLVRDNQINTQDLLLLLSHWLSSGCSAGNDYCGGTDLNRDGIVDFEDWLLFSSNWLKSI